MLEIEVLVSKLLTSVYGGAPCSITVDKVTSLDHKIFDLDKTSQHLYIQCSREDYEEHTTRWNLHPL